MVKLQYVYRSWDKEMFKCYSQYMDEKWMCYDNLALQAYGVKPKCTLEGIHVDVHGLPWKNKSHTGQSHLVGWAGSAAVTAVKMNKCRTRQTKGVQVIKRILSSHLYIQQNAREDCCFKRLKSSYPVIGGWIHSEVCVCVWGSHVSRLEPEL